MEKRPFLSIILPVYSGETFFKRCLDSLLEQKCDEDYEIVLAINLDAEEACKKLAEEAMKKDSHFVSVTMKEPDLAKMVCRLEGVKFSKGEYITFIDNDDYYSSKYAIDNIVEEIKKGQSDITVFPYFLSKRGKEKLAFAQNFKAKKLTKEQAFAKLNHDYSMPHFLWNKAFKRDLFDNELMVFDHKNDMFEDCVMSVSLFLSASSFYRSNYAYYCYVVDNPDAVTKEKRIDRTYYQLSSYACEKFFIKKHFPTYLKYWKRAYIRQASLLLYDSHCDRKNGKGRFFHYLGQLNKLHRSDYLTNKDYKDIVERTIR